MSSDRLNGIQTISDISARPEMIVVQALIVSGVRENESVPR